tara:strand:- start:133 stop:1074 length:942 start_codon:yes stop_codon:yes gene_type:complete
MKIIYTKNILFTCLFVLLFFSLPNLFEKHRDAKNWEYIYNVDYDIDILFMGSSLAFRSLNPNIIDPVINHDSFNLGSSSQNIIQTYYNLIEVLKYRKIKLIILDVNTLITDDVKIGYIYNNISGMYFSKNKINSFLNSINKNTVSSIVDIENLSLFKEFGYVSSMLIKEKFNWKNNIKNYGFSEKSIDTRGFSCRENSISLNAYIEAKKSSITNRDISLKNQKYLSKFINLCKNNNIDLIFLHTPVLARRTINKLDSYIEKYDIPYYDYNFTSESDYLNYNIEDFSDEFHLSSIGSRKFSLIFSNSLNYYLNP